MHKAIARKSVESGSHNEGSDDFQDLYSNQSVPSNDRISAEQLLGCIEDREVQTSDHGEFQNQEKFAELLSAEKKEMLQEIRSVISEKQYLANTVIGLAVKLEKAEKLSEELSKKMNQLIQENAEMAYRLHEANDTIQQIQKKIDFQEIDNIVINSYQNRIQAFNQQLESYQLSEREVRKFFKSELKIETGSKPLKSVVVAIISDFQKNLIDVSSQVTDLFKIVGDSDYNRDESGQYNHWKEIDRIQKLGDYLSKFKSQSEINRSLAQSLNVRVRELEHSLIESGRNIHPMKSF